MRRLVFVLASLTLAACGSAPECTLDDDCAGDAVCDADGRCVTPLRDAGAPPDGGPTPVDAGPVDAGDTEPPPPAAIPRWPFNGASTGSVHGSVVLPEPALRPLFAWDPAPGATRYELEVTSECSTPGFGSCAFETPTIRESVTETSFRAPLLEVATAAPVGRRYYWRVRACAASCSPWSPVRYLDVGRLPNDVDGDGYSEVIGGAHADDQGSTTNVGRVFVWRGGPGGPGALTQLAPPRVEVNGYFGITTAALGDVNADGFADVAVGAHGIDAPMTDNGEVYVYLGSATGLPAAPSLTLAAPVAEASAQFGRGIAPAGDVDGDGFMDLLVSAFAEDVGGTNRGRVYLFRGGPDGIEPTPATTLESPDGQEDAQFGFPLAIAGDVDGDGFADVLVGARLWDGAEMNQGRAYLFAGSAAGLRDRAARTFDDPTPEADGRFGRDVGGVGDLNGDRFADLVVGGRLDGVGGTAAVYLGGPSGPAATPDVLLEQPGGQTDAEFGFAVAGLRDANGDGRGDLIVGARLFDRAESNEGRAYVFYGTESGVATEPDVTLDGAPREAGAQFGYTAMSAGDVNGDGIADAVVGSYNQDTGAVNAGALFVYLGASSGLSTSGTLLANPRASDGRLGVSSAYVLPW